MTDTLSSVEEDNNQPEAMDPAKEDMADLSLSKLIPPPTLPPGTNGENEPISAASNNPNGKEEEEKDLGGATEMKGNCEQGTVLLSTLQDNTKQDSGNKDEPMETDPVSQPSIEEEEEHSKEDEEQQAIEGDEPVDDNMETESSASHEHKTTPSTDVTSNNTKKKDKDLPPPATRQMRGNRTTPTNKRARRANAKPEEEGKADEDLSGSATTSGNETETDDKGKVKAGKGRGRGASRQNPKDPKTEQSNTPEDSLVKGPARKGGAGAQSYSAAYRVTRATAAAAGIKTVDFIQLPPSAQKKRKRGIDDAGSDDTDQPNIKKTKGEEDEEIDEGLSDEESVSNEKPAPKDKPIPEKSAPEKASSEKPAAKKPAAPEKSVPEDTSTKFNPRMRGRGRGKRGVAKSEQLESPSESVGAKKVKQSKDQETCHEETEDTPSKDTPTKKKRGRPKRKGKEDKETTPPQSFPNTPLVKTEEVPSLSKGEEPQEETGSLSEPVRKEDQILGLLQLSENVESGSIDDTIPPVADHGPYPAPSNDDGTSLATPSNQEVVVKQEKVPNSEDSSEKPQPPAPLIDDGNVVPISQTTPTSIPIEGPYQFPLPPSRYSHDTAPYPYPPHIHPSFMPPPPHSYSPLHYHPFIIPTSPHFPPYPPPPHSDCLTHPLYFSDDPFGRYPPQSTAAQSPSPSVPPNNPLPTSASNKVSSPPMESPVTTSGGNNVNHSHPTTPTVTTPVTHGMPLPHPLNYNPSHMPPPHHHPGYPIPSFNFALPGPEHWNHQMPVPPGAPPTQAPPPIPPPPPSTSSSAKSKDTRLPTPFIQPEETQPVTTNPVNCPECGRHFKNNKALNGHMRLHGGFDWTKRICRPYVMGAKKEDDTEGKNAKPDPEEGGVTVGGGRGKQNHKENKPHNKSDHAKVKEKETRPPGGTLDDLCRAAEELERIDRDNSMKPRPSPLTLPHERRIASFSPPYTPPPILSPARSLVLLSGSVGGGASGGGVASGGIPTPNKIWPQRKGSDNKGVKDLEEPFEPKINIGDEFQAAIPNCVFNFEKPSTAAPEVSPPLSHEALIWEPMSGLSQEDEDTIDGYLELACSPAVPYGGRNKELALQLLKQVNGSVKEAVRLLVMGKSLLNPDHELADYNYTGSKYWSPKERQQFRRAWRVHRKQFNMLQSSVETKSLPEIIEYYYSWKKYCPDEYRGRNRHVSEELLSEEEEGLFCPSSTGSHSSDSNDADQQPLDDSAHINGNLSSSKSSVWSSKSSEKGLSRGSGSKMGRYLTESRSFSSHSMSSGQSVIGPSGNQEHRCKYPGCNQVYSSIFALNGHIRIHGGSWYPKKFDVETMREESPPLALSDARDPMTKKEEELLRKHQLEVAKTMVMELSQPRSPVHPLGNLTPSPKPSPGHGRSSLVKSKKACSASPADKEGFYPCNRCGRVFHKVKSRSAHMKSHIIKQQVQ